MRAKGVRGLHSYGALSVALASFMAVNGSSLRYAGGSFKRVSHDGVDMGWTWVYPQHHSDLWAQEGAASHASYGGWNIYGLMPFVVIAVIMLGCVMRTHMVAAVSLGARHWSANGNRHQQTRRSPAPAPASVGLPFFSSAQPSCRQRGFSELQCA